jgi:16S rRNA (uracil1498-N3)-methyltransferase
MIGDIAARAEEHKMARQSKTTERTPPRLYVTGELRAGEPFVLSGDQAHYLGAVMRRKPGDPVLVFNGRDGEWLAEARALTKRSGTLAPMRQTRPQTEPPDLWLLFAPIKRQRIDVIAEKAAELGVRVLQPVLTRRTAVERVNLDRLEAHAIEAAEQCGLLSVPVLRTPLPLERAIDDWDPARRLLYCDESGTAPPALEALRGAARGPWAVLIGPEGGFNADERAYLKAHPATFSVSLGPRIMRADTAAIAALSLWQAVLGDWDQQPQRWANVV